MIKKKLFALATSTVLAASVLAGCGNSSADSTASTSASAAASVAASTAAPAASTAASTAASSAASSSASADASAEETLTGTISDIKDMSFVVTDDKGTPNMFAFEGDKPTGLDQVKDGDKVTVTYTGKLSEVDAFTGTIKSVEKAK